MSNRPFEEQLRERLGQHPTPLDLDALWDKVEPRLPQKRERILPIWIWSISGLALLASLLFWYYGQRTDLAPTAVGATPKVVALAEASASETSETTSITLNPDSPVQEVRPTNTTEVITSRNESPGLLLQPAAAPAAAPEKNGDTASAIALPDRNLVTVANQRLVGEEEQQSFSEADWPITPEDQPELTPAASARPTMKIPALVAAIVPVESEFALVIPPAAAEVRSEELADPVGKQLSFDEREVARRTAIEVRQAEASKKATTEADIAALKAKRVAEREAAKRVAKLAKQAEVEQKAAEKAAADKALAEVKARRAEEKKAARLAQAAVDQAEENRRIKARQEAQKVVAQAKPKPNGKMERIRARNIEQDRRLAEKRAERQAAAQQSALEAAGDGGSKALAKKLAQDAKRVRKEAEKQRLAAQFEERSKRKAAQQRALFEKQRIARAERAQKAREWLAKRDEVSPEEEQKAFQKKLEAEARKKRLAFEKGEKERYLKVQKILKKNRDKYKEADRSARLAMARQRRAEKEARRLQRALAKTEKPKKIDTPRPEAYWSVEPGLALSLPLRTISGGGEQGRINETFEKALEGISLQGLVGHHRPSGFSLRTGLVSSRINSKVETEVTTQGFDEVSTVVSIIIQPDGGRQSQVGTVQVANETVTKTKYYNAVNSLDVPLLLGYRFQGSKFGLTLEAGPTFNLSSGGNAHLYDGSGGYREVTGSHFRQKLTGLGVLANFGGAYNLSEHTMLTANLRIQRFGGGGFEDVDFAGYSTQFTLVGVQFGYRIKF